jgi:uncharacterized protein
VITEGTLVAATFLIIFFLGTALGLSVGLVGTGSVLAVPLLVYGVGLDVHTAICVAMLTMTLLGFVGSIQKLRVGEIDTRSAAIIAISGALFAPLGAWFNKYLSHVLLLALFASVVLLIAIGPLLQREPTEPATTEVRRSSIARSRRTIALQSSGAGALIGLLGGLLGISGGFIAVPVLITYQGLEMHRAVATTWAIVALVSASASIGHFLAGQRVPLEDTLLFLIGGIVGFEIALRMAHHFSSAGLKRLFAAAIFLMSVVMLVRLLAG